MSDNIEQWGDVAAFASLRKIAWHGLGTVFDKPVTTAEMMSLAYLDKWNVRLVDLSEQHKDWRFAIPAFTVVRDNPADNGIDVLGVAGGRYRVFQNEDLFAFGDNLTVGNRRWETAGSINGGRRIFASLAHPDDIVLDPSGQGDVINRYVTFTTSHDGTSPFIAMKTNIRVVCKNTLNMALGSAQDVYKIRHTTNMGAKIEDAKRVLGYADAYDEIFEAEAKALIEQSVTDKKFFAMVEKLFPKPAKDAAKVAQTKWANKTDYIMSVWNGSTGSMNNLDKNGWRAYNALTEANQWGRNLRNGNSETFLSAGAGFDNITNAFRQNAYDLVKARVL